MTFGNEVWPLKESTNIEEYTSYLYDKPCTYILSKSKLGDGSYSTVFECKNKFTGLHYAAKQYKKKLVYGLESSLQNEFQILKKVSNTHPNILTLIDYFETADDLYLVTDLALGGELFSRIVNNPDSRLPESQVIEITKTLVSTIAFLHDHHIVHRDLKAENLLFQSKNSKNTSILVADFGLARSLQYGEKLHDMSGTLSYVAPEILDREVGHGFPVDMWSLGVIVYFMLCGYMPFDCDSEEETKLLILKGDFVFEPKEYWDHISVNAMDFISSCFKTDPLQRMTASHAIHHPFINFSNETNDSCFNSPEKYSMNFNNSLFLKPNLQKRTLSNVSLNKNLKDSVIKLKLSQSQTLTSLTSKNLSYTNIPSLHRYSGTLLPSKQDYFSSGSSSANLSSNPSKYSLIEISRNLSLAEGSTLQGERCVSPDLVSNFSTPIGSTCVSREQSYNELPCRNEKNGISTNVDKSQAQFYL